MSGFLSILIILVCGLLILAVLVQNSKGGGLSSTFASNNQIMGVRKTADFLEKATWGLAIGLFILSLLSSPKTATVTEGQEGNVTESVTRKKADGLAGAPAPAPVNNPAPAQPQPGTQPGQ